MPARKPDGGPRPPGPPPDQAMLRDAALKYLARYSATQASLLRVLTRRVDRWARAAEAPAETARASLAAARMVVERLVAVGAVDDAAFAAGRARTLHRAGRSRRAIAAHLQAKGVPGELAALPEDPDAELAAALLYCGRRRMGPFRPEPDPSLPTPDPALRAKDLARLARAGFPGGVAARVLAMPAEEAEERLIEARSP